jgi:hypothetical protein
MNNVQERLPIPAGADMLDSRGAEPMVLWPQVSPIARSGGDRINQMFRPVSGFPGFLGGGVAGMPIVQQLISIIQQLLSALGFGQQPASPSNFYQNATASSTGDPHLSFSATDFTGNAAQDHFDSMAAHSDLLDSDSFNGGYQISTAVTQPGANGVTYNRQATISTNFGQTQVSLDKDGNAYIMQHGHRHAIAPGAFYNLGNGESVRRNDNGSIVVTDMNGEGGSITTTLTENGSGVDVRTQAQNVDLGGDLVTRPPLQSLL